MGSKEKIVILIMAFFCVCVPALTDRLQGNMEHGVDQTSKFSHGSAGGHGGGHPEVICGGGSNGGSSGSNGGSSGGAAAIIPFAAGAGTGAANNHHNHPKHNGCKSHYDFLQFLSFASTTLACLLLGQKI